MSRRREVADSKNPATPLLARSCGKSGVSALQRRERQRVDSHRRGGPPAGRLHHPLRPLLEAVSDGQAGVPARRDDLHPAEAEGRGPFRLAFVLCYLFILYIYMVIAWPVTAMIYAH